MKKTLLPMLVLCFWSSTVLGQQESAETRDNSKPTNVYSQIDNFLEYMWSPDLETFGYNPRITYAPNADNLILAEIPLLYSSKTERFGLGDIRLRYFGIPYRDYTKFFGSFGASVDVFLPTGKVEDGLGSSSWRVSPGVIFGFILNEAGTVSLFPVISYIYTSRPTSDLIPEDSKEVDHGFNIQVISSFVLSDDAFIQVTPIYDVKDLKDEREDEFILEVEPVVDIMRDKYQVGAFYRVAFESETHTFRLNFTIFL